MNTLKKYVALSLKGKEPEWLQDVRNEWEGKRNPDGTRGGRNLRDLYITRDYNGSVLVVLSDMKGQIRVHRYFQICGKGECSVDVDTSNSRHGLELDEDC